MSRRHLWQKARAFLLRWPVVLALAALLGGCSVRHRKPPPSVAAAASLGGPAAKLPPEKLPEETKIPPPMTLGPGDKVELELLSLPNTRRECLVMPDGRIYYDILPGQQVRGKTPEQIRELLQSQLAAYYKNPTVGLIVREIRSRRLWILGRVNAPGIYPLDRPTTLLEGIARAGGLFTSRFSGTTEELADLRHSFVMRDGKMLPVDFVKLLHEGDMSQNIQLAPGDYIYLPSALSQEIYVLGAVNLPRSVAYRDKTTLASAIAAARDVKPGAHTREVLILRGSLVSPEVYIVNYESVRRGRAPDVELQPRDIVWVPDQPWNFLEKYARTVITTFVGTVVANEAANLAVPGSTANIPINIGE